MKKNNDAQKKLIEFARTYENLIGSDETLLLLDFLTQFAEKNPETILEIRGAVVSDPDTFSELVEPESISRFKQIVMAVQSGGIGALISEIM